MSVEKVWKMEEKDAFLALLHKRFHECMHRHENLDWEDVAHQLYENDRAVKTLMEMENTGGEPDALHWEERSDHLVFVDFAKESPSGRRSFCYDDEALEKRKTNKPADSAMGYSRKIGIELLREAEYRKLQEVEELDLKTSSWVITPENIRKLGGALFCDRRYNTVFTYHNGAESYYGSRGFRGKLVIPRT